MTGTPASNVIGGAWGILDLGQVCDRVDLRHAISRISMKSERFVAGQLWIEAY